PDKDLLRAARLLGRHDRGQLSAANVSDDLLGGRIQPADDPVPIDDVRGNPDPFDGVFDLAAYRLELGHACDSPPRAARLQTLGRPADEALPPRQDDIA